MPPANLSVPKRDRRGSVVPVAISIAIHVVVIGALIQATRADAAMQGAVRDIPRNTTVIAMRDSARISGVAAEGSARVLYVRCVYELDGAGTARLVDGPVRKRSKLGCRKTLPFSPGLWWKGQVVASYGTDGTLEEIDSRPPRADDPLVSVVKGWDLATPRPDRQWPGLPTFTIRIDAGADSK